MANNIMDVAEVLTMLLPPGLVFEDPTAYAKLADQPVVPWEDLHKLWNSTWTRRPFRYCDALQVLTLAIRLYFQVQEVPRSHLRSPGELLVARLGERQAQPEWQDAVNALEGHCDRPHHCSIERASQTKSGRMQQTSTIY